MPGELAGSKEINMLDIGWSEILVIAIVAILVVGPKELPGMLRTFGRVMSKLRAMAGEFRGQFEEALKEADLDDVRKGLSGMQKLNPMNSIRDAVDPLRQMGNDIKADLQKASKIDTPVTPAKPETEATSKPAEVTPPPVGATEPSIMPPANVPTVVASPGPIDPPMPATDPVVAAKPAKKSKVTAEKTSPEKIVASPGKQNGAAVMAGGDEQPIGPVTKPARKTAKKPVETGEA